MKTMRVRMLQTKRVTHDQFRSYRYDAGQVYRMDSVMAKLYISQGIAIEDKALEEVETKKKRGRKKKTG